MKGIILRRRKLGLGSCNGIKAVTQMGIDWIRNDKMTDQDFDGVDIVFRWGCTSTVPVKKVVNTASAIHLAGDKARFRRHLCEDEGLSPYTPKTAFNLYDLGPLVSEGAVFIRPRHHSMGKNAYKCETIKEAVDATKKCGEGWYAGQWVDKVSEYRVFVCQGRVVWVASKTPENPDAIVWNVAQGGKFENVKWGGWINEVGAEALQACIDAVALCGLDFGGVDIMFDVNHHPYIIEINSAPSQTSPYRQQCTAKAFDYILEHGKEALGLGEYEGWRKYIHPAIWSKKNV